MTGDEKAVFRIIYQAVVDCAVTPNMQSIRLRTNLGRDRTDNAIKALIERGDIIVHGHPQRIFSIPGVQGETVRKAPSRPGDTSEEDLKRQNEKFVKRLHRFFMRRERALRASA